MTATTSIEGGALIAGNDGPGEGRSFRAIDPRTEEAHGPTFHDASRAQAEDDPATTVSAHTSVGATGIDRWLRSVVYQDTPDELPPPALRDANLLGILRLVDGRWNRAPVDRTQPTGGSA